MNEDNLLPGWQREQPTFDQLPTFSFVPIEKSEWKCYLFGATTGTGLVWQPNKGAEPNWFWRKMQFLILGFTWIKT